MASRLAPAPPTGSTFVTLPGDDATGLLQQPTKLLGCLRVLGRPRRSADPLLVAAVYDAKNMSRVDVRLVDVASGAVAARLDGQGNGRYGAAGGLVCLVGAGAAAAVSVLDPATGDVTAIPAHAAAGGGERAASSAFVFGHVPATGAHKVLRVYGAGRGESRQSCEILTLDGGDGGMQRWRPARSPPVLVGTALPRHWAVTGGGVAHFLVPQRGAEFDGVASFDLATEKWRPGLLRCPLSAAKRNCCSDGLSLVELNGCLAFVHHDYLAHAMDMWVLTDQDKGTWLRVESLPLGKVLRGGGEMMAQPLMVLEDGRIAFWVGVPNGAVRVYNPRTGGCEEVVNFGSLARVIGLYRGGLLGFK